MDYIKGFAKRRFTMGVNYKPLWKLLIDKEMEKSELRAAAGIAGSTLAKMYRNEYVALNVLVRICNTLHCQLSDVAEIEFEKENVTAETSAVDK
jgi:DNA-binding Xre family transcriptional regulator